MCAGGGQEGALHAAEEWLRSMDVIDSVLERCGARVVAPSTVRFRVWAPWAGRVAVRVDGRPGAAIPLDPLERGYWEATVSGVEPGAQYRYVLDERRTFPDPASCFQPFGVHGASAVVDHASFPWSDREWAGLALTDLILYELHVGTFTPEGTFEAIIPHLSYLRDEVGVTAIELMPIAQFSGTRNWGYDGVYPFAPQHSYGGPDGLKALVNACHASGLGVMLDVVYNHLGPEGNYLPEFGPFLTERYRTPWGPGINFDGPDSDEVRKFFTASALHWLVDYHIDGFRLDAVHSIYDCGVKPFLRELAESVHREAERLGRSVLLIGESNLNDTRVTAPGAEGGYALDAQWNDDFHHALHARLTGERNGYYQDFGRLEQLGVALREGFVFCGQWSSYRRRRHGTSARHLLPSRLVVYAQNHDHIGNRPGGERLSALLPFAAWKVASAAVLLAPNVPLLFMGEEYGETAPFHYFIGHSDPHLIEAVRTGRRAELAALGWQVDSLDPQDPATFEDSRIDLARRRQPPHGAMLRWTHELIRLRKTLLPFRAVDSIKFVHRVSVHATEEVLTLFATVNGSRSLLVLLGFNRAPVALKLNEPRGAWQRALDASSPEYGGAVDSTWPVCLVVGPEGVTLTVPAFGVAVYVSGTPGAS